MVLWSTECDIREYPYILSVNAFLAYEKGHQRPPLTVYTFQAPEHSLSQPASPVTPVIDANSISTVPPRSPGLGFKSTTNMTQSKPPLPTRCSSLERPAGVGGGGNGGIKPVAGSVRVLPPNTDAYKLVKPTSLPPHITKGQQISCFIFILWT